MNSYRDKFLERVELVKRNLWRAVTFVIIIFMLVVIGRNAFHAISISSQMRELNREKADYQRSITADSLLIEQLKSDEGLERYAREKYRLHRDDEELFIIE